MTLPTRTMNLKIMNKSSFDDVIITWIIILLEDYHYLKHSNMHIQSCNMQTSTIA